MEKRATCYIIKVPIRYRTQSDNPISCYGEPAERTKEIAYPSISVFRSTGFRGRCHLATDRIVGLSPKVDVGLEGEGSEDVTTARKQLTAAVVCLCRGVGCCRIKTHTGLCRLAFLLICPAINKKPPLNVTKKSGSRICSLFMVWAVSGLPRGGKKKRGVQEHPGLNINMDCLSAHLARTEKGLFRQALVGCCFIVRKHTAELKGSLCLQFAHLFQKYPAVLSKNNSWLAHCINKVCSTFHFPPKKSCWPIFFFFSSFFSFFFLARP